MHKALLIKGNPIYLKNNPLADTFYTEIKEFLENLKLDTHVVSCMDSQSFLKAELWVGHSRGGYSLSSASNGTICIAVGSSVSGAINHPKDNVKTFWTSKEGVPNKYHYVFTEEMKVAIQRKNLRIL